MLYQARYYNGKSSTAHPARVELRPFEISITYTEAGIQHSVTWQPDKIHKNDFIDTQRVYLKYGDFPHQYLEVNDPQFVNDLKQTYRHLSFHTSSYDVVFSKGMLGLAALTLAVIGLVAAAYFWLLPFVAESFAKQMPIEWEEKIGNSAYEQMVQGEEVDEENSKRLNAFFKQMGYTTAYNIRLTMVKDPTVNAYAVPGGRIVVYEGIVRTMDDYTELVALLSHEFSHVEQKHSTRNIFRSLSTYLFISVLFGDASGITAVLVENANQLKNLSYSRELEHDADAKGLALMKQKGIDPRGMENLFQELKKEEGDAADVPGFLSTHPLTQNRITFVRDEIKKGGYRVQEHPALDSLFTEIKNNLNE